MTASVKRIKATSLALLIFGAVFSLAVVPLQRVEAAACSAPATDYGTATTMVNIPAIGSYKIWSRLQASSSDASHNSFLLEIDGNTCMTVGDHSSISNSSWTWVDYKDGSTGSKVTHNFSSTGNHTIKMIGRETNVKLDRVIFTQDMGCVPTGTGDNCALPPDNTPPVTSLTNPANGAIVNGQVTVSANASDADSGIQKVAFYHGSTLIGEDTSSSYSVTWDTSTVPNGSYNLTARTTNGQGLQATSAVHTVTVNNAGPPDLVVADITMSPENPEPGQEVTFSATIANQGGTATFGGTIHGVLFKVDGTPVTWSDDSTESLAPGATRTVTANGGPASSSTWQAVAGAHTITAHVDAVDRIAEGNESNNTTSTSVTVSSTPSSDTTPPTVSITAPTNNADVSGTINVTANANDNKGVARVEFIVGFFPFASDTTPPYIASLNTTDLADGPVSVTAKAYDAAGNVTQAQNITINIKNQPEEPKFDDADLNQDGKVDLLDFSLLAQQFGKKAYNGKEDINRDGKVDILDFSILASRFGK